MHTAPGSGGAPHGSRRRWWAELLLIVVVYAAYSGGRLLARGDAAMAVDHGVAILQAEKLLHLNAERPLNRLFTDHPALGIPADFAYASLHYLLTPAILIRLWKRHPAHYRLARTWLLLSTLIGLAGFILFPTCPPRLLDAAHGFVDTMAQYGSYGWWGDEASAPRGLGGFTNQYAAMPSLHVGWALWCGVMLWRHGRSRPARTIAVGYPLLTTLVVLGTANHYALDAVAGAAAVGLGLLLTRLVLRLTDRLVSRVRARSTRSAPGPGSAHAPGSGEALAAEGGAGPAAGPATGKSTGRTTGRTTEKAAVTVPETAASGTAATTRDGTGDSTGDSTGTASVMTRARTAPVVSGGCETSAGERLPQQPAAGDGSGDPVTADDAAAAAAR